MWQLCLQLKFDTCEGAVAVQQRRKRLKITCMLPLTSEGLKMEDGQHALQEKIKTINSAVRSRRQERRERKTMQGEEGGIRGSDGGEFVILF